MAGIRSSKKEADLLATRFVGVNQAAFARDYDIPGGASMVSQHIKGRRPINMEAGLAYARGFKVPLDAISPRLAQQARAALAITSTSVEPALADAPSKLSNLLAALDRHLAAVAPERRVELAALMGAWVKGAGQRNYLELVADCIAGPDHGKRAAA